MRILQISYSLVSGGAERLVVDLANELSRQGHDVSLCILLDDTIDVSGFLIWFYENYPKSVGQYFENPDIQYSFK